MIEIAASLLSADLSRLGAEVDALGAAGIRRVHVDVMDGHFVPSLGFSPQVVRALRPICDAHGAALNAHLMIERPADFIAPFAEAGAHGITIHIETAPQLRPLLDEVRDRGLQVGVAVNPDTPIASVMDVLDDLDWCLVMTVQPGFGGQTLIPSCLDKVRHLAQARAKRRLSSLLIAVDGGVHADTIVDVLNAGADIAVVGSGLFNATGSLASNVAQLGSALALTPTVRASRG